MAKYFLAVTVMVCAALLGAANAQEPTPQPKPQEKATQQKPQDKTNQPKPAEKAAQPKTDQEKTDQENQKPALAKPAGDVVSIDAMKNELVIKDNTGVETHLLITPATTITKAGKTITLADIKAGDKITSECEDTSDGFKAKAITVTPAPTQ